MNHPNFRFNSIHELPVNLLTPTSSKTRIAPLSFVFAALVALGSATTPAFAQAVNFGSINVCPSGKTTPSPCSANETVTFSILAGTTISSIAIVTTGIPDLDFKAKADDPSTTLCKAQTYSSATTCTVDINFAPISPGTRKGAVELLNGTTVVAMTYIYGTGIGPASAFNPSAEVFRASDLGQGVAIAVDAAGNPFVAYADSVQKLNAATGYNSVETISYEGTLSIALDGAGNLFANGEGDPDVVYEFFAADDYKTNKTVLETFATISGIAVDAAGNLFVAYPTHNEIRESLAAGGYTTYKYLTGDFNYPNDIALDADGNLFVADTANSLIKELTVADGYKTVKTLASRKYPTVIAMDAADDLYVVESTTSGYFYFNDTQPALVEILAAGGYTTVDYLNSYAQFVFQIAVDSSGNVFTPGSGLGEGVDELVRSQPAPLAFPDTVVGGDNQLVTTAQNVGSGPATFSGLSLTNHADFSLASGSSQDCAVGLPLAPGAQCDLDIDFTPQAIGSASGSLVLTESTENTPGSTQSIALSGTGLSVGVSPTVLDFGSIPYPDTATQTLTVTNGGKTALTIDPSSNGRGAVIAGNTCGASLAAGKSCTLQVEFKPVQFGLNTNTITIKTNGPASPQVPVRGTATGVGSETTSIDFGTVNGRGGSSSDDLTVTNFGVPGSVTVATETGATTFTVIDNSCTAGGLIEGTSCDITVRYAPVQQGTQTAYLKLIPSVGPEQIIVMTGTLVP